MLLTTILSFIGGLLPAFIPEILKFFQKKQDNKHELDLLDKQIILGEKTHLWKLEEINTNADIRSDEIVHKQGSTFGIQLLDAAKAHGFSSWLLGPIFVLFSLGDFLSNQVRTAIAYVSFGFYVIYKWAGFQLASTYNETSWGAIRESWTEFDQSVLMLVLGFHFGGRAAAKVFGKKG